MYVIDIIPYKVYTHTSGRTASPYGSAPWTSNADKPNWTLETRGYTWLLDSGTVGLCRVPALTYIEAVNVANQYNDFARSLGIDAPKFS